MVNNIMNHKKHHLQTIREHVKENKNAEFTCVKMRMNSSCMHSNILYPLKRIRVKISGD